ncbi:RNA-binding protein [Trypanosoma rangeli]|uniref:RNA-binding protein n=1 Tax=Trypanosoma rangeli TaxID=5698 RepID=A0A422P4A4_TRYRA|nr:RNA-binding protein [Trypanosoma rangeli]RNF12560.1 RNA-binding protein [Trypanosoma rangeli]|eukprot:RNF12560.1 RNA-binding protein [Trypanosoma rangeli]
MDSSREIGPNAVPGFCSVYVANIPPSVDSVKLKVFFSSAGKVLHVKLLLDIATGMSRGVAFIMFENIYVAKRVCEIMNRAVLDGSVLQVRLSERSTGNSCVNSHVNTNIVYIRNVPGIVALKDMQSYCECNFGPVVSASLHPQSCLLGGQSPYNMVFVQFVHISDACQCVESMDGKAPFPFPYLPHPFVVAKMIEDVEVEKRKSIILRSRNPTSSPTLTYTPILAQGKVTPPVYVDSTGVSTVICDAPSRFIAPGPVVPLVVAYQHRENNLQFFPALVSPPEAALAPQAFLPPAHDPQRLFFASSHGYPMLL